MEILQMRGGGGHFQSIEKKNFFSSKITLVKALGADSLTALLDALASNKTWSGKLSDSFKTVSV